MRVFTVPSSSENLALKFGADHIDTQATKRLNRSHENYVGKDFPSHLNTTGMEFPLSPFIYSNRSFRR